MIIQIETLHTAPSHRRSFIADRADEQTELLYGLSDLIRYNWPKLAIQKALTGLARNIAAAKPAPGLVAQITGSLVAPPAPLPRAITHSMVGAVVHKYSHATGA